MVRSLPSRVLCWATLVSLAVTLAAATQPALGAPPAKKMFSAKRAGRLSASYAQVATPEQRQKIDKVQEEYLPKIEALQSQIKTLKTQLKDLQKERDEKVAAVLTPEQKKQADEAAKKPKDKPAESAAPAAEKPAK
jgi:Spy/CpxP family protein refolding chaperone